MHRTARKHGISDADVVQVATSCQVAYRLEDDEEPARELRLGFDTAGRLLEVVVLIFDDGRELAIHAMKARTQYRDLLG